MLAAQIWQESRGNLEAISTNGGNGLTDTGLIPRIEVCGPAEYERY